MLSSKKSLPINELQVGMMSAMDVSFEGKILLGNGVIITESIIHRLKTNYIINKLDVYLYNDPSKILELKIKTVQEIENTFNEFSSNLEDIFTNISYLRVPEMIEIRTFCQKIQNEFFATGAVIKDIVFYGSGNDTIYRHSINVAAISFILGKWIGLNKKDLSSLTYSAILHDFGKMEIPEDILSKKDPLSLDEYETFKTHAVISYHFVKQIPYIDPDISRSVLLHHERMDGSGYPLHVKKDKIPKFARIIAIADLFDEISSNRHSRKIKGPLESLKMIQDYSVAKLDCSYCTIFLNHIVNYYMGENILLNDNRQCKIIQVQMNDLTRPILLDENGFLDLKKEKDLYVEKLVI